MKEEAGICIEDFKILKYLDNFSECLELIKIIRTKFNFNQTVYIYCFDNKEEILNCLGINIPSWSFAFTINNSIVIIDYNAWKDKSNLTFAQTLIHEFVHIAINYTTKNKCPLWLNEGLAQYYSSEYKRFLDVKYKIYGISLYELSYEDTSIYYITSKLIYSVMVIYGEELILNKIKSVKEFKCDPILGIENMETNLRCMIE